MPYAILVIDDEQSIRETAGELLQKAGHTVLFASSGKEGLAIVQTILPHLILLDYYMPGMNGLAVLKRLKSDPVTQRVPIVAFTAGSAEEANALSRAGCIGFIPKPFTASELITIVAEILRETVGRSRGLSDSRPGA
jgi:CheY-like chemotaxis protein